jgi:hypothetical protein
MRREMAAHRRTQRTRGSRAKPKGNKGALLKGMSRLLPRELLDSKLFAERLRDLMRGYAGIYALYDHSTLYYVGLTGNLLGRVRSHTRDRHRKAWDHFLFYRIQRVRYLKDLETLIHNLVDTPGNRVRGKVPPDADVNRALRAVVTEHERTLRDLKKALRR